MKNCCKYPVFHSPLQDAFLCRHDMEIVATTIRVHEYAVRRALTAPKHCSAENKHRAALFFLPPWQSFLKLQEKKNTQHFLGFLVSSALQKTMYLYRWAPRLGHPFYLRGHFSTFRFRCERPAVHYISVTLSLFFFQG